MQLYVLLMKLGTEVRLLESFEIQSEASDLLHELEEFVDNYEGDDEIPPAYKKYISKTDLHIDFQETPEFRIGPLSYTGDSKLSSIPKKYIRELINLSHEKGWICKVMPDHILFEKIEKELEFSLEKEKGNFWVIRKNEINVASIGMYNGKFVDKVIKALDFLEI